MRHFLNTLAEASGRWAPENLGTTSAGGLESSLAGLLAFRSVEASALYIPRDLPNSNKDVRECSEESDK